MTAAGLSIGSWKPILAGELVLPFVCKVAARQADRLPLYM